MLNFDPHRWLAERGTDAAPEISRLAALAGAHPKNENSSSAISAANPAKAANANVRLAPTATLRQWHRHLSALDDLDPPAGYELNWWAQAVRDAWWIYENFASRAVRDGWSAHDLFGVLPWHHGWGGLCDRLRGARNLKMEGPKAIWSSWGVRDWTCAGAGDNLKTSGATLIWELEPKRP
ncbi:MAG: hypothetical protein M0R03_10710 [Novosphingobium sp.]|nr:hypothetical protein [Novosphingobium sp.]